MESAAAAAERLGAEDGRAIVGLVADLKARGFEGRTILVDGSQYGPSWRALEGGSAIWADDEDGSLGEIYSETLDRYTDEAGAWWEDGCLWFSTVDPDEEEDNPGPVTPDQVTRLREAHEAEVAKVARREIEALRHPGQKATVNGCVVKREALRFVVDDGAVCYSVDDAVSEVLR